MNELLFNPETSVTAGYFRGWNHLSVKSPSKVANSKLLNEPMIKALILGIIAGEGTDYANLTYTFSLNEEEYGVAMRKDSDLVDALNAYFAFAYAAGIMDELADEYGLTGSVIAQ